MDIFDFTISLLSVHDIWLIGTVLFCFLVMVDDIFIDFLSLFSKTKPHKITQDQLLRMNSIPEKKIAVMIANWHEDAVLERMVAGNIQNIKYSNYEILLGVYPNDLPTLEAARRLERKFKNVRVIVNRLEGPTSKGQMLNRMVYFIDQFNRYTPQNAYDILVIQDAEDVIHQYALKLINYRSDQYEFIQIPVFSLDVPLKKLTAGIYIDEFTESHTKNLLVRDHLKAGVPSAGVGTAVTRQLVSRLLKLQNGHFLNEKTLTEDYYLGLTCYDLNVKAHFACEYFETRDPKTGKPVKDFVATRELFPQEVQASIKQKTRWTMGICLQSLEQKRPRSSQFFGNYFLWRDRKGLISAPLFLSSVFFTFYFIEIYLITGHWPELDYADYQTQFLVMLWVNLFLSVFRIFQRMYLVTRVYNFSMATLVPVRWMLSNYINTMALINAVIKWGQSKIQGKQPAWSKTDHIIPEGFGENVIVTTEMAAIPPRKPLVPAPAISEVKTQEAQI